jgi:iron(III) transport system ATP-binding protein
MPVLLELESIECRYDTAAVVRDLTLDLEAGRIVCLLGPSGCGKTTALRAIAGFEPIYAGVIRLRGTVVSRPGYTRPPEQRHFGMVFQDYALFPHLNVTENITFGLTGGSRRARGQTALELMDLFDLQGLGDRYPHELSGGQQQRVALARALAPRPSLILMDEPFSNLDVDLRERLSRDVRQILKGQGISGVLVTHDQHEAFAMGDQIGVMAGGRLLQWDTPYNLYHEPANRFVADFIGQGKFIPGIVLTRDTIETELGLIRSRQPLDQPRGVSVDVLLRPDDIVPDATGPLSAEVLECAFKGAEILYTLGLPTGAKILSLFPSHRNHRVGERVRIRVQAEHVVAFARSV